MINRLLAFFHEEFCSDEAEGFLNELIGVAAGLAVFEVTFVVLNGILVVLLLFIAVAYGGKGGNEFWIELERYLVQGDGQIPVLSCILHCGVALIDGCQKIMVRLHHGEGLLEPGLDFTLIPVKTVGAILRNFKSCAKQSLNTVQIGIFRLSWKMVRSLLHMLKNCLSYRSKSFAGHP